MTTQVAVAAANGLEKPQVSRQEKHRRRHLSYRELRDDSGREIKIKTAPLEPTLPQAQGERWGTRKNDFVNREKRKPERSLAPVRRLIA
jgi:hypothetical protein